MTFAVGIGNVVDVKYTDIGGNMTYTTDSAEALAEEGDR